MFNMNRWYNWPIVALTIPLIVDQTCTFECSLTDGPFIKKTLGVVMHHLVGMSLYSLGIQLPTECIA